MWMQIIITPSKVAYHTHGTWFESHDWVRESRLVIEKMMKRFTRINPNPFNKENPSEASVEMRVPKFLDKTIEAMSAKTAKVGFETGIRVMYIATKEIFKVGVRTNNSRNIRLMFRQYAKPDCNQLLRHNSTQGDAYSGIFLASKKTVMLLANRMLKEYRERSFFHESLRQKIFSQHYWHWPIDQVFTLDAIIKAYFHTKTFVLNTEEIATMWHFPGQILKVPTLERIESKEASPPPNLPM